MWRLAEAPATGDRPRRRHRRVRTAPGRGQRPARRPRRPAGVPAARASWRAGPGGPGGPVTPDRVPPARGSPPWLSPSAPRRPGLRTGEQGAGRLPDLHDARPLPRRAAGAGGARASATSSGTSSSGCAASTGRWSRPTSAGCSAPTPATTGCPRPVGTPFVSGLRSLLGGRGPARDHAAERGRPADVRRRVSHHLRGGHGPRQGRHHGATAHRELGVRRRVPRHPGPADDRRWPSGSNRPELFDFFVEQRAAMGLTIVPLDPALGGRPAVHPAGRGAGRAAVRPGHRGHRHRGRVLRRDDDHAGRAGHAGAADRSHAGAPAPSTAARAATTGPSSSRRSTPPGRVTLRADVARLTQEIATRLRRSHPACPRAVARLPAAVAGRPADRRRPAA